MDLLKALIVVSEKAANIARVCRQDEHLFQILVQKKQTNESNPRFVDDFKTLADVLIQEMVRHDIGKEFNELSSNIRGEENNVFKNKLGEKITVEVKPSEAETSILLETVLNGDHIAASLLAAEVHRDLEIENVKTDVPQRDFNVDIEELGIWIDPIDCTTEYVHGIPGECKHDIHLCGLKCVTVLIGAFNRRTGAPVMGVINRPFLDKEDFQFSQSCIWGVSLSDFKDHSRLNEASNKNVISISSSESEDIKKKLRQNNYDLIEASGAGYKILTVILGLADAYILTKGTTFKWDTCAPHAILQSLNGDIVHYSEIIDSSEVNSISYYLGKNTCNVNGIVAYRNENHFKKLLAILKLPY